jgi:hypothetical protein
MLGAGAAWGIALLTKFSALLLLPALLAMVVLHRRKKWREALKDAALLLAAAWLTVNLGMGFSGSFRPLRAYTLASSFGKQVAAALPGALPVPLPADWVIGFDQQKLDTEQGEFGSYLFGTWSDHGFWHYNLVALAVKNPLPFLLLLMAAPWFWWRLRVRRAAILEIALPALVFLAALMTWNRLDIGVRYLLPLFPFLFLFSSAVWSGLGGKGRWQLWAAGAVLASHLGVAIWLFPEYLRYFNAAVGGPANGQRLLLDSNLDWGQDVTTLARELETRGNPTVWLALFAAEDPARDGVRGRPLPGCAPVSGWLAISANVRFGLYRAHNYLAPPIPHCYDWLDAYEPVARPGWSIFLYQLPERDVVHLDR